MVSRVPGLRLAAQRVGRTDPSMVLFQAWDGRIADSPRAISEELHRRAAPVRHVWVTRPGQQAPEWAETVPPEGPAYLRALGSAGVIFSNTSLPGYFRKRASATYVQTWHGTPLKRIAFDIERPSMPDHQRYLRNLTRDVAAWDALVSPNPFTTSTMRRAFGYEGRVLETGYPRNDALLAPDRASARGAVRARLGLAEPDTAVLIAPTWRDNDSFSFPVDLGALAEQLGGSQTILLRAHHLVAATVSAQPHPNVVDVSSWPDVRELLLAADVLVTDYSSVMFDFAITRKPMIFFVYDLDRYRDDLRGFYLDFAATAPGPLLRTSEELCDALRDVRAATAPHAEARERFRERFCALEDGGASGRVLDAVLPHLRG